MYTSIKRIFLLALIIFVNSCNKGNPITNDDAMSGKIVFTSIDTTNHRSFLYRINMDGSNLTQLMFPTEIGDTVNGTPRVRGSASDPRWSPDGKKIIYRESLGPDESHIVMMNEDGSHKKNLTVIGGYATRPKWSPKGDQLMYFRGTYLGAIIALAIVDTNGYSTDVIGISDMSLPFVSDKVYIGPSLGIDWAGSENFIYLYGSIGKRYGDPGYTESLEIFRFDIAGKKLVERITYNTFNEGLVEISHVDNRLVFSKGVSQTNTKIFTMAFHDSVATELTSGPNDGKPKWSNDGSHIIYVKDEDNDTYNDSEFSNRMYIVDPREPLKERRISPVVANDPDLFFKKY
ncbi:MAG TPA: hypothetical protein VK186_22075 [Candidatus Deferrimicrobium sp.]|nr:hypothetical protein [Candidatus Deferrimicrobium sp.]